MFSAWVISVLSLLCRCSGEVIGRDAVPLAPETSLSSHRVRYGFHAFRANYAEPYNYKWHIMHIFFLYVNDANREWPLKFMWFIIFIFIIDIFLDIKLYCYFAVLNFNISWMIRNDINMDYFVLFNEWQSFSVMILISLELCLPSCLPFPSHCSSLISPLASGTDGQPAA